MIIANIILIVCAICAGVAARYINPWWLLAYVLIVPSLVSLHMGKTETVEFENCHLIRHKKTGYPMTVNGEQLSKAMKTGDYELVERNHGDGVFYNDVYIPPGKRIKDGHRKTDNRLN